MTDKLLITSGSLNTSIANDLALTAALSDRLALSLGYASATTPSRRREEAQHTDYRVLLDSDLRPGASGSHPELTPALL